MKKILKAIQPWLVLLLAVSVLALPLLVVMGLDAPNLMDFLKFIGASIALVCGLFLASVIWRMLDESSGVPKTRQRGGS